MVKRQRELIAAGNYVAEGRDIGTVVSPDSPLKVFLTADERGASATAGGRQRRAGRRGRRRPSETGTNAIRTRADSPLRVADGAIDIDTTDLTPDEVVEQIAELARERGVG